MPDLDAEPEKRERDGDRRERGEHARRRLLVVEDGEDRQQAHLNGREEIEPIVKQPLLVHAVLPEAIDLFGREGDIGFGARSVGQVGCGWCD
jgi:hypothetical protein